jgi:L,D-transpeptidase YbiS
MVVFQQQAGTLSLSLRIVLDRQQLEVLRGREVVLEYPVSTSKYGAGERSGSFCTPRGGHVVRAKIGDGQPLGAVFVGRRPTGEIYNARLARQHPDRDWILTRILWLSGTERGHNRMGDVDTMRRYIYIHGTPDSSPLGLPGSMGCIRMSNEDVLELFDRVRVGTLVEIA